MKFYIRLMASTLFCTGLYAQKYPASAISADIKAKAHLVVRDFKTTFTVKEIGEAVTKIEEVITIMDEKGVENSTIVIPYNKFTKVNDIEAVLYDENGTQIKKLKRGDIENLSGGSGSNSIDDSYFKYAHLSHAKFPYTIAFGYEITSKNMMFYPTWQPIPYNTEGISVEKASFNVVIPDGLSLRYKEQNMPTKALISKVGNNSSYLWEVSNLKAIESEAYSPNLNEILPTVYTAPTAFKVDNYTGNINNWSDLAQFYYSLNQERGKIPTELAQKIKDLVKNEPNETAKIKKVYEYLQANTRYVSIQLGIGGWQSMKAQDVATKGYGDCKALTTFTQSMLEEIGIKSLQALVKAGGDASDILTDFPSFQFNHVFLCVPQKKDTLWLECTSQTNPFGYLSDFTSNRHVLLVEENGGKLVKTPSYQSIDNQLLRKATLQLNENGEAEAEVETMLTGLQQNDHSDALHSLGNDDQKKWLQNTMNLPSVEIKQFSINQKKDKLPSINEKLSLHLRNVASKSGTRIFIKPNIFNKLSSVPLPKPDRKVDFVLRSNFSDTDSIRFTIPEGYIIEFLPETTNIQSKFGNYSVKYLQDGSQIVYVRKITMLSGNFAPTAYNEYADYRRKLVKADGNQIVLVKKN